LIEGSFPWVDPLSPADYMNEPEIFVFFNTIFFVTAFAEMFIG
jgi:hypothetical protein